jgi:hypothetical protein
MKANLKTSFGLAALGLTLLANTAPMWAGSGGPHFDVSIECPPGECVARGSMVTARYSADRTQSIGCTLDSSPSVRCYAQDSAGHSLGCASTKRQHVETIQRMTDSSVLEFWVRHGSPACYRLYITNPSWGLQ